MVYKCDIINEDLYEKLNLLFGNWEETLIYSCLQNVMGDIYVDDLDNPKSANAYIGCFSFLAGKPNSELLKIVSTGYSILIPQSDEWEEVIAENFDKVVKYNRYAIKKDTVFDRKKLESFVEALPEGYRMMKIDSELYEECKKYIVSCDFVSSFSTYEMYQRLGLGYVIMKDGVIVGGASSYARYKEGIEIEIDVEREERRKGLASACGSALILECLDRGLYPSWDAQNKVSVLVAQKLGYEFDHEYIAYAVDKN